MAAAFRENKPYKLIVNEVLRRGLGIKSPAETAKEPFRVKPFDMGLPKQWKGKNRGTSPATWKMRSDSASSLRVDDRTRHQLAGVRLRCVEAVQAWLEQPGVRILVLHTNDSGFDRFESLKRHNPLA